MKEEWEKNGDMKMEDHHMGHDDWKNMECMMSEWGCDSAASLGATATVLAATMAALF